MTPDPVATELIRVPPSHATDGSLLDDMSADARTGLARNASGAVNGEHGGPDCCQWRLCSGIGSNFDIDRGVSESGAAALDVGRPSSLCPRRDTRSPCGAGAPRLIDDVARWLDALPEEDEEISEHEEAAVQETRDEIAAGAPLISLDEIKREFGHRSA